MATAAQLRQIERLIRGLGRPATAKQLEGVCLAAADADLAGVAHAALEAFERTLLREHREQILRAEAATEAVAAAAVEPPAAPEAAPAPAVLPASAAPALALVAGDGAAPEAAPDAAEAGAP